tara:strand:+ start:167 stop:583 length:417 start_codon:yes stop_codon:yes gene_type:complete
MKLSLRMDLGSFINTDIEEEVLNKLESIHKDDLKYYLTLWYRDGSITSEDINKFLRKYENKLHLKTKIVVDNKLKPNDFIWYDITKKDDINHEQQIRFQYVFSNQKQIFEALNNFHSTAKFCLSDKPTKKQKRNDYED